MHEGIASQTVIMGRSISFGKDVVFTTGAAKNAAVKGYLESAIGTEIILSTEPQIVGALGAALSAADGRV
jgi:activator of 2-hydroxyglutaryl-CoA dehydratase